MSEVERNKADHHPGCYETWNEYAASIPPTGCVCNLTMPGNEPDPRIARVEALVASYRAAVAGYGRDDALSAFMSKVAGEIEAALKESP